MRIRGSVPVALALAAAMLPGAASAHHAMDRMSPSTAWNAWLSGLAHPVVGLDHLAFVIAAGVIAGTARHGGGLRALAAMLVGGLAGAVLHIAGWSLGPVETLVALTVVLAGAALALPRLPWSPTSRGLVVACAVAGVFHGHAYAETVVQSPMLPTIVYLATLGATQAAIGIGAMLLAQRIQHEAAGGWLLRRLAGLGVLLVGGGAFTLAAMT